MFVRNLQMECDPRVMVNTDTEDGLDGRSVSRFISSLKSSFQAPDFDKMKEYLTSRERSMKREKEEFEAKTKKELDALRAELEKKKIENQFLEGKHAEEVSGRLALEAELNECKRECELLKENVTRLREDYKVTCDREKRGEERYARLLEELKRNQECVAQLRCRNRELECEKRLTEEIWRKRFGELGSRVLALETDTEMLKRMTSDSGVRTACFPALTAAQEAPGVIKIKEEMDLGSTSGNYVEKSHAAPVADTSCHTPPEGIPSLQGTGGRVPASVDMIDISSDSDDEEPGVMRMDSTEPGSKEEKFRFLDEIGIQDKLKGKQECPTLAGPEDTPKRKEASSSTQIPRFLKRFRGKINVEYAFDTSSDNSSDSGSEDLGIDHIMTKLRSKHKA